MQSNRRRVKRDAMHKYHLTFSQRLTESIRTGKPIADVRFESSDDRKNVICKENS